MTETAEKLLRFLSHVHGGIDSRARNALGAEQAYRLPTFHKHLDQQLYAVTKVDLASICRKSKSDLYFEINRQKLMPTYRQIAAVEISRLKHRNYWIRPDINRFKMEQELNFIFDDLDFRISQTVGEWDFKAATLWRIINGTFCRETAFNVEHAITQRKRDFFIEIYVAGLMEKYLECADKILRGYRV